MMVLARKHGPTERRICLRVNPAPHSPTAPTATPPVAAEACAKDERCVS